MQPLKMIALLLLLGALVAGSDAAPRLRKRKKTRAVADTVVDTSLASINTDPVARDGPALAEHPLAVEVDLRVPDFPGDDHAGETQGEEGTDGAPVLGREKAFEQDCRLVAERTGWDLEATREHMRNQAAFGALAAHLERRLAHVFGGAAYARAPGAPAELWIKGRAPARVAQAVGDFGSKYGVKVVVHDGMRFSAVDQDKRQGELEARLARRGFRAAGSAVRAGDLLYVTLPATKEFPPTKRPAGPGDAAGTQDRARVLAEFAGPNAVTERLLPGFDAYGVVVTFTEDAAAEGDEHAYGGRRVYADDTDGDGRIAVCTSAFSVYRVSDGKNGVATAAHCTGMVNFDAVAPEADFDLYHRDEHRGAYGDVEWKSSSHWELAEYYADAGASRREVNSVDHAFCENDWVCVYSRVQGERNCEQIYSVNVVQGGDSRLIAVDNHVTTGGDSGGPWSWSTEAAGVHKGYKTIWFKRRSTFSKAKLLNSALGVRVKTM